MKRTSKKNLLPENGHTLLSILDKTSKVVVIYDPQGNYLLANDKAIKTLSRPGKNLIGKNIYDVLAKNEADKIMTEITEVIENKKLIEYETTLTLSGGLQTFMASRFPLEDAEGRTYGVCSMATDVTERKKWETEVKRINAQLESVKKQLESKNKDITDSINYAKRIQRSTLPHRKDIWNAFPNSFVLFKPKDIVSGDFYFFDKKDNLAFIAAGDCTGHGVPGAFMSIIGIEKLKDAISLSSDTSRILYLLNQSVKFSLRQSESDESVKDGIDLALCCIDLETGILKYAGANRPLWIIRKNSSEVEEIKPTKHAVGGFTSDNQHFSTQKIQLQKGDSFYVFSDGYADTFGGEKKKKLKKRRFKEMLLGIQHKTMAEQKKYLNTFIEDWKNGTEQIDDILVMGVKF